MQRSSVGGQIAVPSRPATAPSGRSRIESAASSSVISSRGDPGRRPTRICNNWFYGTIPATISKLTQLSFLALLTNYLVGTIPPLPATLQHIDIPPHQLPRRALLTNYLVGTIPPLPATLQHIDVQSNFLTGPFPFSAPTLLCSKNCFTDNIPTCLPSTQRPAADCAFCGGAGAAGMCRGYLEGCMPDTTGVVGPNVWASPLLPQFCAAVPILPAAQSSVLMALKSSLGVTDSTWGATGKCTGEKATQASPYWSGVRCADDGSVVSIALLNRGLKGALDSFISVLSTLTSLDLSSNLLNQPLHSFLSGLSSLTFLKQLLLGYNWFYGSIPATISQLTSLTGLSLFSNYLTGSLPSLPSSLVALDVAYNFLSGSLPSLLLNLKLCAAEHNCLTPDANSPCRFFGYIQRPAAAAGVAGASATERCAVCGIGTEHEGSACWDGVCAATASPTVVAGGPNGPAKAVLDLQCTGNTEASMTDGTVAALLSLKSALGVTSTTWSSAYPCAVLGSSGTYWSGIACDNQGNVLHLDMPNSKLKGSMAAEISMLTSLTRISLYTNLFWMPLDSFTSHFTSLSNLIVLQLYYNWFYGSIPSYLLALPSLTKVALLGNYLTGSVPVPISTALSRLVLSYNFLSGSVPSHPYSSCEAIYNCFADSSTCTTTGTVQRSTGCAICGSVDGSGTLCGGTGVCKPDASVPLLQESPNLIASPLISLACV
ncbi:hypothetical protein CLOP_g8949 [Closterium sp. NIES-67]|nr:hypothetical protein CLOP_g8949 [Closterium sp. NIES-67]